MSIQLQFLGAAGTVTGSRHLLQVGERKVLVDCGLFQGLKELRLRNREPFPVDPSTIDAVILTHAHLDHSGYLPLLYLQGFRGPIFATAPTRELTRILLFDAASIEEEDAQYANDQGFSKHSPALPLFTTADVKRLLPLFREIEPNRWQNFFAGWRIRLQNSGHILGSSFIEIEAEGKRIVFSGDLGRRDPFLLLPRVEIERADILVLESTYGDRLHPTNSVLDELAKVVTDTIAKRGHLLVPSFALGRTQDLLHLFGILKRECRIPNVPIFLDSPLGEEATEIYVQFPEWRRKTPEGRSFSKVATILKSRQQSKEQLGLKNSSIVIAGSGMVSGGRILHHLAHRVGDSRNTVLLVGYQAEGTRGRQLKEGAAEIKIHGRYFPVRAEVRELTGLSAHADQAETLEWLQAFQAPPACTFLVHGEPQSLDVLRLKMKDVLGWPVSVAKYLEKVDLSGP